MLLYHGSNCAVKEPKLIIKGYPKDFGYGFYTTKNESQAIKWAKRKAKNSKAILNIYEFDYIKHKNKIKIFNQYSTEWAKCVAYFRSGQYLYNNYEAIEGPVADDDIWDYALDYIEGRLPENIFLERARFKELNHQILFRESLMSELYFLESLEV